MKQTHGEVRLAVLDDGQFVRNSAGEVRPVAATFNRFVEAVARSGQFGTVRYLVPVGWGDSMLDPVDESVLEVVPTAPFRGIADYLVRSAYLTARNWRPIDRAVAESDLVWLRLPASNALLALNAARRHGTPHFSWVAGSVEAVARAQRRIWPLAWSAHAIGRLYDLVTAMAGRSGPTLALDDEYFASVVTHREIAPSSPVKEDGPWRIVWAGRMAGEKGLPDLSAAIARLAQMGTQLTLVLIGDGPARSRGVSALASLLPDSVEDHGYVADRARYMELLRGADLLIQPSRSEGVSKVLVEAMAAGLPIVAADSGATAKVLGNGERGVVVAAGDPDALANAIRDLLDDSQRRTALRQSGLAWAADHTMERQAERLVAWLRDVFPQLRWRG